MNKEIENDDPLSILQKQKEKLIDINEKTKEEKLEEQIQVLSTSLIYAVDYCEDARQFAAVVRLAIKNGQYNMASSILDILIDRLDNYILNGYYNNIKDEELIDIVEEKMKNPPRK